MEYALDGKSFLQDTSEQPDLDCQGDFRIFAALAGWASANKGRLLTVHG